MSRTKRLREEVKKMLTERGEANTVEIFDHLNTRFSWGATMNQVGNILAKDKPIKHIGGSVKCGHAHMSFGGCDWDKCS